MLKRSRFVIYPLVAVTAIGLGAALGRPLFAAEGGAAGPLNAGMSLWELVVAGGWVMIVLGILSIAATASVIYHFKYITAERLTPPDFIETLLSLLEKREHDKAVSLCKSQPNLISEIALKGLKKLPKGKAVVEEAVQYEGKSRIDRLWNNLSYLGDAAALAPMLGLLGTILGMIDAFNYQAFKAGIIKPVALAQGLAKAMITTAFGLIIAVLILIFYSYLRGRIGTITSNAERASAEIVHALAK